MHIPKLFVQFFMLSGKIEQSYYYMNNVVKRFPPSDGAASFVGRSGFLPRTERLPLSDGAAPYVGRSGFLCRLVTLRLS